MRNLFVNLCLLLVSCGAGVALCEASLRLFYPKYRHLAEVQFRSDARRIWAYKPNARDWGIHPDTGAPYTFYHNNLALRQHRDFHAADLAAATNIGIFGDSFTQNSAKAVQYAFTEPFDYLLNQSGQRFNVLNFGVDGYGTGQSLLHYEHFRYAADLDHVVYVYCRNDLWDLYATGLFHLDAAGHLVRNEAIRASWWVPLIRRLHTPYLVLDVSGRLSASLMDPAASIEDLKRGHNQRREDARWRAMWDAFQRGRLTLDDQKTSLAIFRQLIRRWKHLAEHNGSTFSVVLLPMFPPQPFVLDLLHAEGVAVIDLYACFGDADPAHLQQSWRQSPYRFKNDGHWNETGNKLAAVCLYRVLEEKTGIPVLSEGRLQEALFRYYAAFGGEIPPKAGGEGTEGSISPKTAAAIREKYTALEMRHSLQDVKAELRRLITQRDKRIIASVFDVYLDRKRLLYVKEECRPADLKARFFLHVIPVDARDLPERQRQHGFENRDFIQGNLEIGDGRCVVQKRLPAYPIRRIHTGQFVKDAQGNFVNLWRGEFSTTQAVGVEEGGH